MRYIQRLQYLAGESRRYLVIAVLCLVVFTSLSLSWCLQLRASQRIHSQTATSHAPKAFMHHPYYGAASLQSRINSYFDHDKPWYASDSIFVRFDGKRWFGSSDSVLNCDGGTNCYDGHDGYDLKMRFEPVLSAAGGKVIRAGWYNALNHSTAYGLWVAIDAGNGYANAYGHLSSVMVSVGDKVNDLWQIGTTGTTGASTGPHLHLGTFYYPAWKATDPSGWKGSFDDPNIVEDNNLWTSGTNETPVPLLSRSGKQPYPGAILVDDAASGWTHSGTWHTAKSSNDVGGELRWTSSTSGSASARANWQAQLPADGYYEVGVFVNDNHASSGWAPYTVYSADPEKPGAVVKHQVRLDQEHIGVFSSPFGGVTTGPQWISLGTYYFRVDQLARVSLSNATGENNLQISADGVEFAPLNPLIYNFTLTGATVPPQMDPGASVPVQLILQNTSSFDWKAQGNLAVQLVYRWLDSKQQVISTSQPVALAGDLAQNQSQPVSLQVQAPSQIGNYTLQWDLIQLGRSFSQLGAKARQDQIQVGPPPVVTPTPGDPSLPEQAPTPSTLEPAPTTPVVTPTLNDPSLPEQAPTPPALEPAPTPDVRSIPVRK